MSPYCSCPPRCNTDDSITTREPPWSSVAATCPSPSSLPSACPVFVCRLAFRCSASSMLVSSQWDRKFTWNCSSRPSDEACRAGGAMMPALQISRCSGSPRALNFFAKLRTLLSELRSNSMNSACPKGKAAGSPAALAATSDDCSDLEMASTAAMLRVVFLLAMITCAPIRASWWLVAKPMPDSAPVTIQTLPLSEARGCGAARPHACPKRSPMLYVHISIAALSVVLIVSQRRCSAPGSGTVNEVALTPSPAGGAGPMMTRSFQVSGTDPQ
mmetsp:Transcript_40341/g.120313  ORF Transcript_40341/g.120313 Transcript_40341/m.120313 type:complete len:272 (-) Transcript_40341:54-869(-)